MDNLVINNRIIPTNAETEEYNNDNHVYFFFDNDQTFPEEIVSPNLVNDIYDNLLKYNSVTGDLITYSISETGLEGYETIMTGNQLLGFVITNKFILTKPEEPERPIMPENSVEPEYSNVIISKEPENAKEVTEVNYVSAKDKKLLQTRGCDRKCRFKNISGIACYVRYCFCSYSSKTKDLT